MLSRRTLLRGLAVGALAGAGAGGSRTARQHVLDPSSGPAFEPWRTWRARIESQRPRGLVAAAIIASSPHNTQPWTFEPGPDRVDVFADPSRGLGPLDPFLRELHIGLGAAVEAMVLASGLIGWAVAVDWLPSPGRPEHVARLRVTGPRGAAPAWSAFLGERHVDRAPYDGRPLSADQRAALLACVPEQGPVLTLLDASGEPGHRFGAETLEATRFIIEDREMSAVMAAWMRHAWADIQSHRDGITLACAGLPPAIRILASLGPPVSLAQTHAGWLRGTEDALRSSPVYALLSVPDLDDRRGQLEVGRLWQRLHVRATSLGLSAQPLNQWPERVDRERQLGGSAGSSRGAAGVVGRSDVLPTFAFRLGVGTRKALPSPRRPVEAVIRSSLA